MVPKIVRKMFQKHGFLFGNYEHGFLFGLTSEPTPINKSSCEASRHLAAGKQTAFQGEARKNNTLVLFNDGILIYNGLFRIPHRTVCCVCFIIP